MRCWERNFSANNTALCNFFAQGLGGNYGKYYIELKPIEELRHGIAQIIMNHRYE